MPSVREGHVRPSGIVPSLRSPDRQRRNLVGGEKAGVR